MATEKTHRRDPASDFYVHLKSNSFLNDKNKAYIRPTPIEVPNGTKSTKLNGWKFAASDKPKVQSVIDKGTNSKKKPPAEC